MAKLPAEVWREVFSYLTRPSVSQLRLASRRLAQIGIDYLSVDQRFFLRKRSLARLIAIADHAILGQKLDKICLYVDKATAFVSKEEWAFKAEAVCDQIPRTDDHLAQRWLQHIRIGSVIPMKYFTDNRYRELGWSYHLNVVQEQEELLSQSQGIFIKIQRSLAKLRNLKSFRLENSRDCMDADEPSYPFSMRSLFILHADQAWYCRVWSCDYSSFTDIFPQFFNTLLSTDVVGAVQNKISPLLELRLSGTDFLGFDLQTLNLEHFAVIAQDLESLELETPFENEYSYLEEILVFNDTSINPMFHQLLCNTPKLRSLSLLHKFVTLSASILFEGCVWQNLESLDLHMLSLDMENITTFFLQHKRCLRGLRLTHTSLHDENELYPSRDRRHPWIYLLKFIKNNMSLEGFSIGYALEEFRHDGDSWLDCDKEIELGRGMVMEVFEIAAWLMVGALPQQPLAREALQNQRLVLDWDHLIRGYD